MKKLPNFEKGPFDFQDENSDELDASNDLPHSSDEKWLISYADMMTLLFGFFVVMYVLSISSKQKMEQSLKEMADSAFQSKKSQEVTPPPPPPPLTEEEKKSTDPQSLETAITPNPDESAIILALSQNQAEKIKLLEQQQLDQNHLLQNFQQKDVEQSQALSEKNKEIVSLQEKIKDMELKMTALNVKIPVPPKEEKNIDSKIKDLEKGKSKISQLEKENQKLTEKMAAMKADLAQIESLKKELEALKKGVGSEKFIMTMIQWETEKHDIDLTVEDPNGKIFSYKKRNYSKHPGEFIIDSRYGPGIEGWRSNAATPGVYKLKIKLYNQFGNKIDSIVKLTVVNNKKSMTTSEIHLNPETSREKTIILHVSESGDFSFQE